MAYDYGETAQDVREALEETGALCALAWTPPPESDAPDAPTPAPLAFSAWGVILDYSDKALGTQSNSLIEAGDRQILLACFDESTGDALPLPPAESKIIAPDGIEYTIKRAKPLAPAGIPVMFDLNVRR